jgi:nitroreductase
MKEISHPKIPVTKTDVHPLLTKRWSARSFAKKAIESSTMHKLFEAASWSASSMNEQPWKYLYAHRGSEAFNRMAECLMDGNKPWAKHSGVLLIALAKRHFDRNGQLNRHHMHDAGAANTTLLLQAAQVDIYGHMIGGFHYDQAIDAFEIDNERYEIACFIALGYRDEADQLEEPFRSRETTARTRKSVNDFSTELKE